LIAAVATPRRLVVAMVLVGVVAAGAAAPGAWARATAETRTTADEPQYLLTAISLAEDADLDIADERAAARYRPFHPVGLPLQERARADGSLVSPHDPLLPVLLAGPVALGGWLAAKLALAGLAGGLAAAMVWVTVRRFEVPVGTAVVAVLAFSLAAPLVVYGTQVYPEVPAALAVTVGIGALTGPLRGRGVATLVGVAVALPWLSVKYVFVAAALVVLALVRLARRDGPGDRRLLLAMVGGLGVCGVAYLASHQALYDGWTVYASGDHFTGGEGTVVGTDPALAGRAHRLTGLLVDRDFGLAAWQPAFLLVVPALAALVRARSSGAWVLVVPLVVGWLGATFVALTMHGWWWPGRQVVVVLPCAVLAVAWWAARHAAVRSVLAAGVFVGAGIAAWSAVEVLLGHHTLIVDFDATANPLVRAWRALLPDGRATPAGTDGLRLLWYVVLAGLAAAGWHSARAPRPAEPPPPTPILVPRPREQPCSTVMS